MVTMDFAGWRHRPSVKQARVGLAVDVHRAGAALTDAAAIFRAGEVERIPDRPQQRRVRRNVEIVLDAVDCQLHAVSASPASEI